MDLAWKMYESNCKEITERIEKAAAEEDQKYVQAPETVAAPHETVAASQDGSASNSGNKASWKFLAMCDA